MASWNEEVCFDTFMLLNHTACDSMDFGHDFTHSPRRSALAVGQATVVVQGDSVEQ